MEIILLIFFRFHSGGCFMMPEKIFVFKQMILFLKIKFGGQIERICRIFFRGFLGSVYGPKISILNSNGPFRSYSRMEGVPENPLLPKICHMYPTMMKLGTVIPYLTTIRKTHKSHEPRVLLTSAFFHQKSTTFVMSKNTFIDCILMFQVSYHLNFSEP